MCGIAAIAAPAESDLSAIGAICDAQAHRGPDGVGYAVASAGGVRRFRAPPLAAEAVGRVALGHRRLSVIDPVPRSNQPMTDASGRLWLSYNGEIYNYRELRAELAALGARFRTRSDTEVLLAAWALWGEACFARLDGIWGLALLDLGRRLLVLARDRFGVKPLHFAREDGRLLVASEIKGVLAARRTLPRAVTEAARDFLSGAIVNHREGTFFDGVETLPAGTFASVALDAPTRVEPRAYWTLDGLADGVKADAGADGYDRAVAMLRERFDEAVRLQMRSDVPLGACLSGGVDSSAIVCTAAPLAATPLETFTAANPDPSRDESGWARQVADRVGARVNLVMPTLEGLLADLDALGWHQDEPIGGTSVFAQWCLMRRARERGVPVLLDGQGADELFCGYRKYQLLQLRALVAAGRPLAALHALLAWLARGDRALLRWREAVRYLPAVWFRGSRHEAFAREPTGPDAERTRPLLAAPDPAAMRRLDLTRTSLPALLRYEDRNSMAFSIESRVPFLDHRLVELALALPIGYALRGGRAKAVLRDAVADRVPRAVLARREKFNFFAPLSGWMAGGLAERLADEIAGSALLPRLLDTEALTRAHRRRPPGTQPLLDALVFRAAMLALWERRFGVRSG